MGKHVRAEIWRNIYCRNYGECLDRAAKQDTDLDCSNCPLQNDRGGAVDFLYDTEGCVALLVAIFRPEYFKGLKKRIHNFKKPGRVVPFL